MISLIYANSYSVQVLKIEQVTKQYTSVSALNSLSLEVPKGSIYGLLGPNGAGKTTLIRIINQILKPDSGRVYFDGVPLHPEHIARIGYLPEERGLYKNMRVGEQALYLARLKGLTKETATERLQYWFDRFDIGDWWDKKIHELSKGMAQKVQFIVTVMHQPKLLIFDEPFSGFDPVNAELIAGEILQLRDQGATIIFSTHRMESVEQLCDHICLLNKGEKVLEGKVSELRKYDGIRVFEIGLKTRKADTLLSKLSDVYEVRGHNYHALTETMEMEVVLDEHIDTKDFMKDVFPFGELVHFKEKLPSMTDLFMNAIRSVNR